MRGNHVTRTAALIFMLAISTSATAVPIQVGIGAFSGGETVHDFEQFVGNVTIMTNQLAGSGAVFNSIPIEPHADYGSTFANTVLPFAGRLGLFQGLKAGGEEISFTTPQTRVGFNFGSNRDVNVPFQTFLGNTLTGSFNLITGANTMPFFGFEDLGGIDRIVFFEETTSGFVSQIDNLRYESSAVPEPVSLALVGLAVAGMGFTRRRAA